jgi:hypothetical protein
VWDTRPSETPEQPEVHKVVGWTPAQDTVTLRIAAPSIAGIDPTTGQGIVWPGELPPGFAFRLWVGGTDYFELLDQSFAAGQFGWNDLAILLSNQCEPSPSFFGFSPPYTQSAPTALLALLSSGAKPFTPASVSSNPRQRAIFTQLMGSTSQFNLCTVLAGHTGAPIEIDLGALVGHTRYVWACLDIIGLPPPELLLADGSALTSRWIMADGRQGFPAPNLIYPWTVRDGQPSATTIEPPEVRVSVAHEIWDPPADFGLPDLGWWPNGPRPVDPAFYTVASIPFSARGCRARRRFHVYTNQFYNRAQQHAFGSLFARVTSAGSQFVQDLQQPIVYATPGAVARDPNAQPTMGVWGYLHEADDARPATAGHAGQPEAVAIELLGIRRTVGDHPDPWANGAAPGVIVTLGN